MRTTEWFQNRTHRAEKRILEAQQRGDLRLGTIWDSIQEISGDELPTENDARHLALVLGLLHVEEIQHLLRQASQAIDQDSESVINQVEKTIGDWLAEKCPADRRLTLQQATVAEVRRQVGYSTGSTIRMALVFQALAWSICQPPENHRLVVY